MEIKALSTGCANCKNTFDLIAKTTEELDVMVVYADGIPDIATIKECLAGTTDSISSDSKAGGCYS